MGTAKALDIRFKLSDTTRGNELKAQLRSDLERAIGHWSEVIRRADVRFTDVNGPRGGNDTACAVTLSLSHAASIVVESRSSSQAKAFGVVVPKLERALRRDLERRGIAVGRTRRSDRPSPVLAAAPSLIGRREGRGRANQQLALVRPEKQRRDLFTDTAQPGVSETDRKAGGGHTARRNTRKSSSGMTVMLEDSLARPSRKSSRRSKGRGKPSQGKERAAVARSFTPKARSQRR